jgi:ClpP class serine protease
MSYFHILERCVGTPLAIEPGKLAILTEEVFIKLALGNDINRSMATPDLPTISSPNNMHVVPVYGSLVNKNGAGASGVTSYEGIRQQVISAVNSGATIIGFDVSSGGGEAFGMFELGQFIAELPSKYNVSTFAFTNSTAASAAYGIMCAAQTVFAVPSAMVGSIGTVMTLFSQKEADKKAGMDYVILRSKEQKALFNPHEAISEQVLTDAQNKLAVMDAKFNEFVSSVRPKVSLETINKLEGNTVFAEEALQIGLIDTLVGSLQDVFDFYAACAPKKKKPTSMAINPSNKTNLSIGKNIMQSQIPTTLEDALVSLAQTNAELAAAKASIKMEVETARGVERQRCLTLLDTGKQLTIDHQVILDTIKNGMALDAASIMFTAIKSAVDASITANINLQAPAANTVDMKQVLGTQSAQVTMGQLLNMGAEQQTKLAGGALTAADIFAAMSELSDENV